MTAPEHQETTAEQLLAAPTLAASVAAHVDDLVELGSDEAPEWVMQCGVPTGWRPARLDNSPQYPTRITVYGHNPDHGWDGCETISVYQFTGTLPSEVIHTNADCTLRGLNAQNITTTTLPTPPSPGLAAVRASGYFTAGHRRIWGQYSIYTMPLTSLAGRGLLIEHTLFIDADHHTDLTIDITQLSNTIHQAFQATTAR